MKKYKIAFLIIILFSIALFTITGCSNNQKEKRLNGNWPESAITTTLPRPEYDGLDVGIELESVLFFDIYDITIDDFNAYTLTCEDYGYAIDIDGDDDNFDAWNKDGYHIEASWFNERAYFQVYAPIKMEESVWPNCKMAELIPRPKSNMANIDWDHETEFKIYIGNTSIDDFNKYVDECISMGWNVKGTKNTRTYWADDAIGNYISIKWIGFNTMWILVRGEDNPDELTSIEDTTIETTIEKVTETNNSSETLRDNTEIETEIISPVTEATIPTEIDTDEINTEELPYNIVDWMSINTLTEWNHIKSDKVILGNDEKFTVTIMAKPVGLTPDDFFIYCNENTVSYEIIKTENDDNKNQTKIQFVVYVYSPGIEEMFIASNYDLSTKGDECTVYQITINKLDNEKGRIVYYTPTGEKYHFSKECAGDNWLATTLYDAQCSEYEPCGKCAY